MSLPVVISYSGGASSEWLVEAVIRGVLPRPEHLAVVFSDTGWEHAWTYQAVAEVRDRCDSARIPFLAARREGPSIRDVQLAIPSLPDGSRLDQPPYWLRKGMGRGRAVHRCTREYKIAPMRRAVSEWLAAEGLPKRVEKWIGFSADEVARALKTEARARNDVGWETVAFPAIQLGRTRAQQRAELVQWTGRAPKFSMCVGCPYKSPARWLETPPDEQEQAIAVDEAIRDAGAIGLECEAYLSDRLIPLRRMIERGDPQPLLPGLESYCDGGACFL